jgi:alkanesulfonate monooxygenase SsuD/methylene tetrahydromethanopterin reductase-like flavin-dependent oxidoreductase (luciferase family)
VPGDRCRRAIRRSLMVQLGWKAGPEQYPPLELLDYAVTAEQAGFDVVDVSDHFHPWDESGQACFSWTWLGAAAVTTSRGMVAASLPASRAPASNSWSICR